MSNWLSKFGAQPSKPVRFGVLWQNRMSTGMWTQRSPLRDAASTRIEEEFYGARGDALIDGLNCEVSSKLTWIRRPGHTPYNYSIFPAINRFYDFKLFNSNISQIRVVADTANTVYDATGPSTQTAVFTKSQGAGKTSFQSVGNTLYFSDGPDQKKWIESLLTWTPNTLYDGPATSDTDFGDFLIDLNNNIQVAVGGFTLVVSNVQVLNNVLTLTLDTSQLTDPTDVPVGTLGGGGTLASGTYYVRVAAVDQNGNTTQAGPEANFVVAAANSSILWTWDAVAGAKSYQIYVGNSGSGSEASYFTSSVNSFTQTAFPGLIAEAPPTVNSTSIEVPNDIYRMVGVELTLGTFATATFLDGQVITISGVLPGGLASDQITATFSHADYASTPDQGTASSGTGRSGSTQPVWSTALNGVTQDGGAQWVNRGYYVEDWGIVAPATAPTLSQFPIPSTYESWEPNTLYWPSAFAVTFVGTSRDTLILEQLTTAGTTGASKPTFNATAIGNTTVDGTAIWTYQGPAVWSASTFYAKNSYTSFYSSSAEQWYVYQAQNAGTTGTTQTNWPTGVGAQVQDGGIIWSCIGNALFYTYYNNPLASTKLSNVDTILDSNGNLEVIQEPGGYSGTTQPKTWSNLSGLTVEYWTAGITAFSIANTAFDGIFTALNNFVVNIDLFGTQYVTITGLTVGSYLNGIFPLDTATNTQFTATVPYTGTVSTTADSGTATVPTGAVWLNTGPYDPANTSAWQYVFAYQNSVDGSVSTASPASIKITLNQGNGVTVQGFGSSDPQVDTINIYRTVQGGATFFFLDQILNPGGGNLWTYKDTTIDADLNNQIEAPIDDENNPPLANLSALTYHLGRIFGAVNNSVYYSDGPDVTDGNGNTAWSPSNVFVFPDTVIYLFPTSSGLIVFTTADVYIIQGLGTASSPLFSTPFLYDIGILSWDAVSINGSIVYLYTSDNQVLTMDPSSGVSEIGFPIGDQFGPGYGTGTFTPTSAHVTWHVAQSQDKGLYVSDFAGSWWRMTPTPSPETGTTWAPRAAITGGFSAVQSVETSPGIHTLLLGPATSGPILERNYQVYSDNGSSYNAFAVLGSLVLAQPGQLAMVESITTDSVAVGTPITLAVQLDEISYVSGLSGLGIINPGINYVVGDIVGVPYSGASGGFAKVTQVGGSGQVQSLVISAPGIDYPSAGQPPVNATGGSGTGLTVTIFNGGFFEALANYVPDPTELEPSTTLYAQRFYLSQTQQPAVCRHLQILVQWGNDQVKNELLSISLFGGFEQEL